MFTSAYSPSPRFSNNAANCRVKISCDYHIQRLILILHEIWEEK